MTGIKKILCVSITFCFLLFYPNDFLCAQEPPARRETFTITTDKETHIELAANKGSLYFPDGSVQENFTLSVEKATFENTKSRFNQRGDGYDFGPDGTVFDKPVQITLPYEVKEGQREDLIHLYYYNKEKDRFEILPKVCH